MSGPGLVPCALLVAAILVAACDAGGGSSVAPGGSTLSAGPVTSSTEAGSTSRAAPSEGGTVGDGDGSGADTFQAQPADDDCGLVPGKLDLSDLPPLAVDDAPSTTAVPLLAAATPVPLPGRATSIGRRSNWFLVGDRGLVRIDPRTSAPDHVLVPTGDCHLWSATAGDGPEAAVLACAHERDATASLEPCSTIVVSVDDGATVARWDTPDGRAVRDLGLHEGQLIIAEASDSGGELGTVRIVRIDARTGEGTRMPVDVCPGSATGYPEHVVDGTALVVSTCPQGPQPTLFLSGAGAVEDRSLGTPSLFPADIEGDGEQVWAVGMDRYDAATLERIGPSLVDPALLDRLIADGWGPGYGGAIEVPGVLWIQRCVDPCGPGPVTIEVARLDLVTSTITDSWALPGPRPRPRATPRAA